MTQKVDVRFIDDLDGSDAVGTVSFALDNRSYEIDLSDKNAAKLRDALAPSSTQPARQGDVQTGEAGASGRRP